MIKVFTAFLILFLLSASYAVANEANVLIVNQIRGNETCCQPGNLKLKKTIDDNFNIQNMPIGWALRYDAVLDHSFTDTFKGKGNLGILLEITPQLTSASGVSYKGNADGSDWNMAKNSFLIGYKVTERKKLIDTAFTSFKDQFGYYPQFSVSWMIDAWSLGYMKEQYQVKLHELTKEQYETDSYTLYGGIFNAPYYPSKNHPLIPGSKEDILPVVMVRQTISDLLYNYGSPVARYTSQPNDYAQNPVDNSFSYFQNLLNDNIDSDSGIKFAVLGLENSVSMENYIPEFQKQLLLLNRLEKEKKIQIRSPADFAVNYIKANPANSAFYFTKDFYPESQHGVIWYFGDTYRARIILKDTNIILDDLRSYIPIADPYLADPAPADYAYWIIPYLFDGSQNYTLSDVQKKRLEKAVLLPGGILPDMFTTPIGISVTEKKFHIEKKGSQLSVIFDGKGQITLSPEKINFSESLKPVLNTVKSHPLADLFSNQGSSFPLNRQLNMFVQNNGNILDMGWENGKKVTLFSVQKDSGFFSITANPQPENLTILDPVIHPDLSDLDIDPKNSTVYWNNTSAIAGRNPIRVFLLPRNYLNRPTRVKDIKIAFSGNSKPKVSLPEDYSFRVSPWFLDITSDKPLKDEVSIKINNIEMAGKIPVIFIDDCQRRIVTCLSHPSEMKQYGIYLLSERGKQILKIAESFCGKYIQKFIN